MIWPRLAPYTRLTVISSRGTDCTAAAPPTIRTKIVVNTPKAIFCGMLTPKTRMKTGRKMDLGTPNRKFTSGRKSAPRMGDSARRKPRSRPMGTARTNAARTSHAVTPRLCSTSARLTSRDSEARTVVGAGVTLASSRPRPTMNSQRAPKPGNTAATRGAPRRRIALGLRRRDRHVHENLARRHHVLHPARGGQFHGLLHGAERDLAVPREPQEGLLVLHLGD